MAQRRAKTGLCMTRCRSVAGACYGRSESTLHPLPVRGEPLSAFEPSEATGALGHSHVRRLENTGSIPQGDPPALDWPFHCEETFAAGQLSARDRNICSRFLVASPPPRFVS